MSSSRLCPFVFHPHSCPLCGHCYYHPRFAVKMLRLGVGSLPKDTQVGEQVQTQTLELQASHPKASHAQITEGEAGGGKREGRRRPQRLVLPAWSPFHPLTDHLLSSIVRSRPAVTLSFWPHPWIQELLEQDSRGVTGFSPALPRPREALYGVSFPHKAASVVPRGLGREGHSGH